jgi:hypothetical protein
VFQAAVGPSCGKYAHGTSLLEGKAVPKDEIEDARYLKSSADQGCAIGEYGSGMCFREGLDRSVDKIEAVNYFRRSPAPGYGYGHLFYRMSCVGYICKSGGMCEICETHGGSKLRHWSMVLWDMPVVKNRCCEGQN